MRPDPSLRKAANACAATAAAGMARAQARFGTWMKAIRRPFVYGVAAIALWMAAPLLPQGIDAALYAVLVMAAAADFLLRNRAMWGRTAALALAVIGGGYLIGTVADGARHMTADARISLRSPGASALSFTEARTAEELVRAFEAANGRPVMVYVMARWCVICRSIERSVFPDANVAQALTDIHLVKLDITDFTAETQSLLSELRVAGPPAMLFYDSTRQEVPGTRLTGSVTAQAVMQSAGATAGTR